ncbi:hypothetical protein [Staphylococcus lutrae]|uniref:Uncharacterized protein n=1 Tax=Staphylococcus lutrae TaxID=155085 RepID=A0AAC9WJ97_9STAP|nr:hypothetical protein [Staphylococcus lutrae]ARJ50611.1 hypothetical protein B5P37_04405 [Staphylococcus lutrae]PNZ38799.1 hypothetical protein CD134_03190 [Staphylococcus lutrae]
MRTIIRAGIAVVAIIFIARFLDNEENIATIENYKNQFIQTEAVQKVLHSQPVQKLQNTHIDDILPSDFF